MKKFITFLLYSVNSIKLDKSNLPPEDNSLLDVENQFFINFAEVEDHNNTEKYPNILRWNHTPESIS